MKLTAKQKKLATLYAPLFTNTGGNDVIELCERKDITFFNNAVVATMQVSVRSQLYLLENLKREGLLKT